MHMTLLQRPHARCKMKAIRTQGYTRATMTTKAKYWGFEKPRCPPILLLPLRWVTLAPAALQPTQRLFCRW